MLHPSRIPTPKRRSHLTPQPQSCALSHPLQNIAALLPKFTNDFPLSPLLIYTYAPTSRFSRSQVSQTAEGARVLRTALFTATSMSSRRGSKIPASTQGSPSFCIPGPRYGVVHWVDTGVKEEREIDKPNVKGGREQKDGIRRFWRDLKTPALFILTSSASSAPRRRGPQARYGIVNKLVNANQKPPPPTYYVHHWQLALFLILPTPTPLTPVFFSLNHYRQMVRPPPLLQTRVVDSNAQNLSQTSCICAAADGGKGPASMQGSLSFATPGAMYRVISFWWMRKGSVSREGVVD
ncbi:hypothetical protein BDQ17DRAFT_1436990 [Cyathus striatus]|nr:hypothetical protein BDQ17DRAFT_1436990 [Cyathus striatus]